MLAYFSRRKSICWPIVGLIIFLAIAGGPAEAQPIRERLAVLPLHVAPTISVDEGAALNREATEVWQGQGLNVIAPSHLSAKSTSSSASLCESAECLSEQAALMSSRYLAGGRLEKSSAATPTDWSIAFWLFDAQTKKTVATAAGECRACDLNAARETTATLARRVWKNRLQFDAEDNADQVRTKTSQPQPASTMRPLTWIKWTLAAAAAISLTTGIILLVKDKESPGLDGAGIEKNTLTNYRSPGLVFTAAGSALAASAGIAFWFDRDKKDAQAVLLVYRGEF